MQQGRNCLSINVLFKLAQSGGVAEVHPNLQKSAWEALVELSERKTETVYDSSDAATMHGNRQRDFENFIPKFIDLLQEPVRLATQSQNMTKDDII